MGDDVVKQGNAVRPEAGGLALPQDAAAMLGEDAGPSALPRLEAEVRVCRQLAAVQQDIARLWVPLKAEGFQRHGRELSSQQEQWRKEVEQSLVPLLSKDGAIVFIAYRDGEPVGLAIAEIKPFPRQLYVEDMFVVPELRSRGIGTQLMREVKRFSREELDGAEVSLDTTHNNPRAFRLYCRLDFEVCGPKMRIEWPAGRDLTTLFRGADAAQAPLQVRMSLDGLDVREDLLTVWRAAGDEQAEAKAAAVLQGARTVFFVAYDAGRPVGLAVCARMPSTYLQTDYPWLVEIRRHPGCRDRAVEIELLTEIPRSAEPVFGGRRIALAAPEDRREFDFLQGLGFVHTGPYMTARPDDALGPAHAPRLPELDLMRELNLTREALGPAPLSFARGASGDVPRFLAYLRLISRVPVVQECQRRCREVMQPAAGDAVLDVGAGFCPDLEELSRAVGANGRVICLDCHEPLLADAVRFHAENLLPSALQTLCSDAQAMPLPEAAVDSSRVMRVLQHVQDPTKVMAEMARVTKPGGRVAAIEPDWSSLDISTRADSALLQRLLQAVRDEVRHPQAGRLLPRWMSEAGLRDIVQDKVTLDIRGFDAANFFGGFTRNLGVLAADGLLSEEVSRAFLAQLKADFAAGQAAGTMTFCLACGVR